MNKRTDNKLCRLMARYKKFKEQYDALGDSMAEIKADMETTMKKSHIESFACADGRAQFAMKRTFDYSEALKELEIELKVRKEMEQKTLTPEIGHIFKITTL